MKKTIILTVALAALLILWLVYRGTESFFKSSKSNVSSTAVADPTTGWVSYTSPTGLFSVMLPNIPEYTSEIERDAGGYAIRTNETYVSEDSNKNLFVIYFIRYLASEQELPLPANTLLNNLMYEMLDKHKGSQLESFHKVNFKGRTGLEFSIEYQGLSLDALAVIDRSDLYVLSTIGEHNSVTAKDFQRFTKSFDFK